MSNSTKKKSGFAFFKWARLVFTFGIKIVFSYFLWIAPYASHPEKKSIEVRYKKVRSLSIDLIEKLHFEPTIKGKEHLSSLEGRNIIVANHLSVIDIVLLIALSEKPLTFIAKKEVESTPFVGKCLKCIDGYFLDRSDPKQAVRLFMAAGKKLRENGGTIVVYPEGTRLKEPFLPTQEFHAGSFKLVEWGQANLLCMAEFGTFRPLGKGESERSFPLEITFFPILKYEELKGKSTQELASTSHDAIAKEIESFQKFDEEYYQKGLNKKKASKWAE